MCGIRLSPPGGKRHPFFGRKPLPHGFSKRSTQTAPARRGTPCRSASRRPGRAPPAAAAGSGPRGGPRAGVAVGARPRRALRPRALGRNSTTAAAALGGGRLLSNAFWHPFLLISVHIGLLEQQILYLFCSCLFARFASFCTIFFRLISPSKVPQDRCAPSHTALSESRLEKLIVNLKSE